MTQRPALHLVAALSLLACRNAPPEPPAPPAASRIAPPIPMPGADRAPHTGTLRWTDPAPWRRGTPTSTMRRAQYTVPGNGPNTEGELTVFWFGAGQGGSIDNNLARWYGQFEQPDGRPSAAVATRETRTSHGLQVTITRVEGRFSGSGMPGAAPSPPLDGYALLAAIVETPNGPWFFKLTGPRATLAAATPAFDEMVASFEFR
ncbi:MAG: hypothetical protein Q8S73_05140 [Deltaproteobacteria bacterium]|nr:hypothetical protein [Myxococcales bacterium]MDP3213465.1 hypothetical protein [Deltaproteobacteria bacterium]